MTLAEPMTDSECEPQPVGLREIAERLGVAPVTVSSWRHRGLLPPPRWRVSRGPVWDWPEVAAWATTTGRLPPGDTGAELDRSSPRLLPDIVGTDDFAARLGVQPATIRTWIRRGQIPPPRWRLAGRAMWNWEEVEAWAANSGRL